MYQRILCNYIITIKIQIKIQTITIKIQWQMITINIQKLKCIKNIALFMCIIVFNFTKSSIFCISISYFIILYISLHLLLLLFVCICMFIFSNTKFVHFLTIIPTLFYIFITKKYLKTKLEQKILLFSIDETLFRTV